LYERVSGYQYPRSNGANPLSALLGTEKKGSLGGRPPGNPPRVRETSFSDYEQIAAVEARNGLTPRSWVDWTALWKGNPTFEALAGQWPIGWVLETPGGEIVGSIGNIPLSYSFQGRHYHAATSCGWAVDTGYRGFSLILFDRFVKQKGVQLLICTTVGVTSETCYKLYGFSKALSGEWDHAAYWITGRRGFAKSALQAMAVPAAAALSYPVSAALFARDLFHRMGSAPHDKVLDTAFVRDFDDRFDAFWTELKRRHRHMNLADRGKKDLTWHYGSSICRKGIWIITACRESNLLAYAVLLQQDNTALGLSRIRLVDFQCLSEHELALRSILSCALKRCMRDGVHTFEITGRWQERPEFGRVIAPYQRALTAWTQYYKAADPDLGQALKDPAVWVPSQYEGDASL